MKEIAGSDNKPIVYNDKLLGVENLKSAVGDVFNIAWNGTTFSEHISDELAKKVTVTGQYKNYCYINYAGDCLWDFLDYVGYDTVNVEKHIKDGIETYTSSFFGLNKFYSNLEWLYINSEKIEYPLFSEYVKSSDFDTFYQSEYAEDCMHIIHADKVIFREVYIYENDEWIKYYIDENGEYTTEWSSSNISLTETDKDVFLTFASRRLHPSGNDDYFNVSSYFHGDTTSIESPYFKPSFGTVEEFKKINVKLHYKMFNYNNDKYYVNNMIYSMNSLISIPDNSFNYDKEHWSDVYVTEEGWLRGNDGQIVYEGGIKTIGDNCFNFEKQENGNGLWVSSSINNYESKYHLEKIGKNCFNGYQYGQVYLMNYDEPNSGNTIPGVIIDDGCFNDLENTGYSLYGTDTPRRKEWSHSNIVYGNIKKIGNNCFNSLNYEEYFNSFETKPTPETWNSDWTKLGSVPLFVGNLESIGDNCFNKLDYVANFILSPFVESEEYTKRNCYKLTTIGNNCFNNLKYTHNFFIFAPNCVNFGEHCFENLEIADGLFFDSNIEYPTNLVFPKLKVAMDMFYDCKKLTSLGDICLTNLINTQCMCYGCEKLEDDILDIIEFLIYNKPEYFQADSGNCRSMFHGCTNAENYEEALEKYPYWITG